jgi:anaphase-promoting complex subunit 10
LISIEFAKKMSIGEVAFFLDYNLDESYTPKKLSIRAGMTNHDLVEIQTVELNEPVGWVSVNLMKNSSLAIAMGDDERGGGGGKLPIRAHFLQICVVSMHQNGRDAHIRQVKVYGPRSEARVQEFSTLKMQQFNCIR